MTNTQAARAILADERATPREKRYAQWLLEQSFAARHRDFDQVQQARQLIGVAS